MAVFHTGDALEVLSTLDDLGLHGTVTSPPYRRKIRYTDLPEELGLEVDGARYYWYIRAIAKELYRHTVPGGAVMWNIGETWNNLTMPRSRMVETRGDWQGSEGRLGLDPGYREKECLSVVSRTIGCFRTYNWLHRDTYIWVKPRTTRPTKSDRSPSQHEYILYFRKPTGGRRYQPAYWDGTSLPSSVLTYKPASHPRHPCPMPEAMAVDLVKAIAPEGGRVLDPFCGIGTVTQAATRLNREGIGIDIRTYL